MALPRFYLEPQQINEAQADIWAQGQREQLADDWAAQARATVAPVPVPTQPDLGGFNTGVGSATPQEAQLAPLAPDAPTAAPARSAPAGFPAPPPAWPTPAAAPPETPSPATAASPPIEPAMVLPPQRPDETISNPFGEAFRQLGTAVSGARDQAVSAVSSFINPPSMSVPAQSTPAASRSTSATPLPTGGFVDYARQAAQKAGIDPELFVRQINQESHFDPNAGSAAGARGIAQIVPKYHPGVDPSDPYASLDYAANLMASHLKTYGGDIRKALVAYNGGGGAVNAMDSGHIYGESQDYLNKILGSGGEPTPTGGGQTAASAGAPANLSLSQFGDKALTADEAYAACGPAAAARLASLYGNTIPLKVALEAAKLVGWTPGGGMAGIGSEKRLMDALGMPTELEASRNVDRIISEAGAGRMVTISTPGHYWSASGARQRADGQTELYVGQSGADLRAGRPWMTIGEIEGAMGTIQGALYSDPSKAVAAGDWMQQAARDHDVPLEQPEHALSDLATAQQKAGLAPTTDETVSHPFGEAFRQTGIEVAGVQAEGHPAGDVPVSPVPAPGFGFDPSHMTPAVAPGEGIPPTQDARDLGIPPNTTSPPGVDFARQVQSPGSGNPLLDVPGTIASGVGTLMHDTVAPALDAINPMNAAADTVSAADQHAKRYAEGGGPALEAEAAQLQQRRLAGDESVVPRLIEIGNQLNSLTGGRDPQTDPAAGYDPMTGKMAPEIRAGLERVGAGVPDSNLSALEANPAAANMRMLANVAGGVAAVPLSAEGAPLVAKALAEVLSPGQNTGTVLKQASELLSNPAAREMLGPTARNLEQAVAEYQRVAALAGPTRRAEEARFGINPVLEALQASKQWVDEGGLNARQRGELDLGLVTGHGPTPRVSAESVAPITGVVRPLSQGGTANNTLLNMYGKVKTEDPAAIPGRVEEARRFVVRKWTDRGIDLAKFQEDAQKAAGRPLTADEMAYEMRRLNPSGAADMRIQNELKPAIQSVGRDADWLKVYLTHKDNIDVGKAMGNADRSFSGGLSAADSEAGLVDMAQQLGPERFAKIEQAAQQITDYGKSLLQRKVDSGLISQELFDDLVAKYPNYSPTRIVDYLKDPAGVPSGRKISVQSAGLKRNTVEGTTRQREDPLASFVRLAHETEALATTNEVAQAFLKLRDLNPDAALMIRKVADDASVPRGYEKMKVFENGVPQSYQMPSYIAKAIKEEPVAPIPLLTPLMNLFRMVATQRNPLFLASNALNDSVAYTLRTSSRLGGPQNIGKIATELVKTYGDSFAGIFKGEFHGDTARYLKGGGSQSGFFSHSAENAAKVSEALQRPHVFAIRSDHVVKDLSRLIGQALTLKPIEAIGERIELAPRVAAMRLAEKSGATAQQAVLAGRTVTIDFSTGGTWAKVLNQVIPFFNVAVQAGTQLPRAYRENPRGFITTAVGLLAAPTVAIEAWNRSDPQRAKDYEDVPQYVKDSGLVFMLPTPAQVDDKGNRKPQYLFLPTREYSPFVTLTREATARAMGADPRAWNELLVGTSRSVSPISGNSGADVFSTGVPLGVSTAMQLSTDQDWYRNSKIVTKTGDEQASTFSKVASDALNKMGLETRPSAVEFAARDVGAGVGGMLLSASDLAAGKARKDERIQSTPGVGGLVGRFVQDKTGERLNRAVDEPVKPAVKKLLADAGIPEPTVPYEISVRNAITGANSPPMELRQAERVEYTRLMNVYLNDKLRQMQDDPGWAGRSIESRNKILEARVKAAREYAEREIDKAMDRADRAKRMQAGREKQVPVAR